jgi:hypothetical protein
MWVRGMKTVMEKIDIILWVLSGGFGLMLIMWHSLNSRMDKLDSRMDKLDSRMDKIDSKMDKQDGRMTKIEHDLIEIKTILRMKECCMIQDEKQMKKAE